MTGAKSFVLLGAGSRASGGMMGKDEISQRDGEAEIVKELVSKKESAERSLHEWYAQC